MLIQVDGAPEVINGALFAAVEMIIPSNHLMLEGHSHEEIDRVFTWVFRTPVAEYTDVVIDQNSADE